MVADHCAGPGLHPGVDDRGSHDNAGADLGARPGSGVKVADCVTCLGLAHDCVLLDLGVLADTGASADHRVRADPRTRADLDAAYRSFVVGGYEYRGRVDGCLLADQEQTCPGQLSRAYRLTWRGCLFTHFIPPVTLGADTASTAVTWRQRKTSWHSAATACTAR